MCPAKKPSQRDHMNIKLVSLLMDVYSERIVTFKKPTIPTRHESELSTSLFNVRISDDVFFIYFKSMLCMELWTQSLLVGESEGNKNIRVLAVCRECTDARAKHIQIRAQKCAGWRLSDWKDFLEDAKSTFLAPTATHSINNNANWVSVILDPVSYLQDQNGHSMLFPSQAWHLRVRFHKMTGLRNLFLCNFEIFFLLKNFFFLSVQTWTLGSQMTRHTLSNVRRSQHWPWNIDKVNIITAADSKKSNKRLDCTAGPSSTAEQ